MTGLLARVSRWLVHREPLWLVTGAGALLDVASYVVPAVPDSWHGWVNAVVVLLTLLSGRAIVFSPDTVARLLAQIRQVPPGTTTGGTVTTISPLMPTGPAGPTNVRRVPPPPDTPSLAGMQKPGPNAMAEPTTGPQTPSGVSSANKPAGPSTGTP